MSGARKLKLKFRARPHQESAPQPEAPARICYSMVLNVVAVRSMSRFTLFALQAASTAYSYRMLYTAYVRVLGWKP